MSNANRLLRAGRGAMMRIICIAMTITPAMVSQSHADDFVPVGFRTPSGNIFCQHFVFEKDESLRCDMVKLGNPIPPQPKDCDYDWGGAFEISATEGNAQRICHSDTVQDDRLRVLDYGERWRLGSFICMSDRTGLTCIGPARHGFVLSRNGQELF